MSDSSVGEPEDGPFREFCLWCAGAVRYGSGIVAVTDLIAVTSTLEEGAVARLRFVAECFLAVEDFRLFPSEALRDAVDAVLGRLRFGVEFQTEFRWGVLGSALQDSGLGTRDLFTLRWDGSSSPVAWQYADELDAVLPHEVSSVARVAALSPLRDQRMREATSWALRTHFASQVQTLLVWAHGG